jgi:hypothetical protein
MVHTPPELEAIYVAEAQIAGSTPLSREDRSHAEKIKKLQAHQQALQMNGGTIPGLTNRSNPQPDLAFTRNNETTERPDTMSIEGK